MPVCDATTLGYRFPRSNTRTVTVLPCTRETSMYRIQPVTLPLIRC